MVAMAGMFLTRDKTFMSFSIATMLVVGVAMIGSLTVLPAILSKLGDRVEKGRIPFLGRLRRQSGENRFWAKVLTPALKHPVVAAIASTAVLVVLAVPVLSLHTAQSGLDSLPRSLPTVETLDRLQTSFVGEANPSLVAVQDEDRHTGVRRSGQGAEGQGRNDARSARAGQRRRQLVADRGPDRDPARRERRRRRLDPGTAPAAQRRAAGDDRQLPDATWAVTGGTAASYDENQTMKQAAPLVFGFVLLFAFACCSSRSGRS